MENIVFLSVYFLIGITYYQDRLQPCDEDEQARDITQTHTSRAIYFIVATVTTVGYGDYGFPLYIVFIQLFNLLGKAHVWFLHVILFPITVPVSSIDKLFTVVFATVGLVYIGGLISDMASLLFDAVEDRVLKADLPEGGIPEDDDDVQTELQFKTMTYVAIVAVVLMFGAVGISIIEGYGFSESLFWAFQTGTTIGKY
jgi:hypothetical protein